MSTENTAHDPASPTEAPLYIRWGAERSPYAIELKLDLVRRIRAEMAAAENAAIEIGGVLVGSLPTAYSSTLRIEDIEMISRSPEDGATFMLDPGQHDRFAEVRWRSRARDKSAVGLFRSHLRPGQLRPSLADRTLLSSEFQGPVYGLLLVQGNEPHSAAFFVAAHGQLPVEPSVREFRFDEEDFRALPEVDPEKPPPAPPAPEPRSKPNRLGLPAILAVAAAIGVIVLWLFTRDNLPQNWGLSPILSGTKPLQLEAKSLNGQLRISWNHSASDLDKASTGTLRIHAPGNDREVKLGLDDLRLGAVIVENPSPAAEITLALEGPGSSPSSQTVFWQNQ